jgi:hypothetical protein
MPNFSARHMPTVSNDPDGCVWCTDGSCSFCDEPAPGALQQGLGPGSAMILYGDSRHDTAYYDVLSSAITNAFDIHSLVVMMSGPCTMKISFRCKCSPSMRQITFRCKMEASEPQVPPDVLVQMFMAKMSVDHIECHIWKLAPNVDLLQNHVDLTT